MTKPLDEQVIVITGASSGIGRETAKRLADKGARVVVSARNEEALDDLVDEIRAQGGQAAYIAADVSDYKDVAALARGAEKLYGPIDTWVNNAGVLIVGDFLDTDIDEARRLFNVNFWGEYHGTRVALDHMKKHGGTIINVTSVTARRPLPLMSVYSASKAAINGLAEALQAELANSNVKLCILMPASIDTPIYQHALSKEGVEPKPVPPVYPPSDVAKAIEKLAVKPRHHMYAGPAGKFMSIAQIMAPQLFDFALGKVARSLELTDKPEPAGEVDNLTRPADADTDTVLGGWGSQRQQAISTAGMIAVGLGALLLVRRLAWSRK